jgi:hypothetical protein
MPYFNILKISELYKMPLHGLFTYDTVAVLISLHELDPFVGDLYLSFLIKPPSRHLKGLLTHAKKGVDFFRIGLVMVGQPAFVFL